MNSAKEKRIALLLLFILFIGIPIVLLIYRDRAVQKEIANVLSAGQKAYDHFWTRSEKRRSSKFKLKSTPTPHSANHLIVKDENNEKVTYLNDSSESDESTYDEDEAEYIKEPTSAKPSSAPTVPAAHRNIPGPRRKSSTSQSQRSDNQKSSPPTQVESETISSDPLEDHSADGNSNN
jgi:hypothetical protein